MILHAEGRVPPVPHTFDRAVVEVDMGDLQVVGQRLGMDGKTVVLGGDLHPPGGLVLHRLVGPAMAELELEGLRPSGQREKLVAQADAENRFLAQQIADCLLGVDDRLGVARTVGEKHPVRSLRQHLLGAGRAGQNRHPATHVEQMPGDVPLEAEVQRHHVGGVAAGRWPFG